MYPYNQNHTALGSSDVLAIQRLYGKAVLTGNTIIGENATESFTLPVSYIELYYDIKLNNLTLASTLEGNTLTVKGGSNGYGEIIANYKGMDKDVMAIDTFIWVGAPIVTAVTPISMGSLRIETWNTDTKIDRVEATIGGNNFTSASEILGVGYTSGTYPVTVRAHNKFGWSAMYNGSVTFGSAAPSLNYSLSVDNAARTLTLLPKDDLPLNTLARTGSDSQVLQYSLTNIMTGSLSAKGTVPVIGGSIDVKNAPSGLYVFRIDANNGATQTFKINLE